MLVPSVTKYNEIYMPDVQTLEESHRMSNITYQVYNSTFNYNGMYMYYLLSKPRVFLSPQFVAIGLIAALLWGPISCILFS